MQNGDVTETSWKAVIFQVTKELERQDEEHKYLTRTRIPQLEADIMLLKIKIYGWSIAGGILGSVFGTLATLVFRYMSKS